MANSQPHHSLPARPPPSTFSAPPPRQNNNNVRTGHVNSNNFAGFTPRTVAAQAPPQASATMLTHSQAPMSVPYPPTASGYQTANYNNHSTSNFAYPSYGTSTPAASYSGAPPVVYPSAAPLNRGVGGTYDPEDEARIAEWNSAYNTDAANTKKTSNAYAGTRPEGASTGDAETGSTADGKKKTVLREGGGKQWEDESLLEWNPSHPRLFVGNLAGEVTDESLLKAFAKYPSLSKARVVRDKKSTKSRSYGFVSFSDTDDYFRAAKEMQGKYIGSHPVLIKRATSEVKPITKKEDKNKHGKYGKNKNNKNKDKDNKAGANAPAVIASPAMFIPRGVQKKGKTNGPRLLG